jgi:predicted nucleic acid-binding protein
MNHYYDTGVLLKLYTEETESKTIRSFVECLAASIPFHGFHQSEAASALQLKAFRGECSIEQANRAIADIEDDLAGGVLRSVNPDWNTVWEKCAQLAQAHAADTGCRTLDTLHVACARTLGFRLFVSTDARQMKLAERAGLRVVNPLAAH